MYPEIRPLLSLGRWINYSHELQIFPAVFGFGGHVFAHHFDLYHNTLESWRV
jgi:hypothetical protein